MLYAVLILLLIAILTGVVFVIRRKRKEENYKQLLDHIEKTRPMVEDAFLDISNYYNYGHYITESERLLLVEKYSELWATVRTILRSRDFPRTSSNEVFHRFATAMTETDSHKQTNNEHFIENQLVSCAQYFDTVLAYPLDSQQREAILSLEDNVLVISSAGSGKTMTTVGKVRYLIDIQHVPAEKILLITFTRKAAESLSERLGEKKLKCRTFHKLALDIIGDATNEKPTITPSDFSLQVYHKLMEDYPDFKAAIADYILQSRYSMRDQFEYDSREAYIQDRKIHGIQAFYKDMDGHPVFCKSDEESIICDFLGSRGIKFRYEEKYEVSTVDAEYRQYCPDFSIYIDGPDGLQKRIYLEHFAINEFGRCPSWFTQEDENKYLQGITWKRDLHQQYGTVLLETTSAGFHRGDVLQNLSQQLLEQGAVFTKVTNQNISRELVRQEESILAMLTAFNFLLKSRATSLDVIRNEVKDKSDAITINSILAPFIKAYLHEDNPESLH